MERGIWTTKKLADAGHDYKTIETKGFRNLTIEQA